jgi:two-component sensor histidine kinase
LAKQLFGSYRIDPERVHLSIQADEVLLDVNTAVPCGLLCHELISNCLKHAFPGQQSGDVTITIRAIPAGQLTVTIHDTGISFPESVDFHKTQSLGLQVPCLLTKQLLRNHDISARRRDVLHAHISYLIWSPLSLALLWNPWFSHEGGDAA